MPDKKDPAADGDDYRTDTFSRNDAEGLPGPQVEGADVSATLAAGEEGEYETDTFSRGDREGLPGPDETPENGGAKAKSNPDPHTVADDADSRDATPPAVEDGGVH